MTNTHRAIIVGALAVAVMAVLALKSSSPKPAPSSGDLSATGSSSGSDPLPRLVDLGANKCIPCKMMAPILAELAREYRGRLEVEVIDLMQDHDAGVRYKIGMIPTQIFFSPDGRELYRHEGFMAKEDILQKWRELGFDLKPTLSSEHRNSVLTNQHRSEP